MNFKTKQTGIIGETLWMIQGEGKEYIQLSLVGKYEGLQAIT